MKKYLLATLFLFGLNSAQAEVLLAIEAPISAEWQLAVDQYVSRKMDMTVVYPRSQVSIDGGAKSGNTWARHLYAYPNIQYKIPIVVQGGAYPFKCELVSGPVGMTMGETYGSTASPTPNYCQIVWTAPASGTFPVSVKLYDQDYQRGGNPSVAITLDWDVQVTAAPFRFVSQGATGGDGLSPASPWGSIDDWYGASSTSTEAWTAGARIIYYLDAGGAIEGWQTSGSPANQNVSLGASGGVPYKPVIHLGYPGDSPIIDLYDGVSDGGEWYVNNVDDFYIAHLEVTDGDPNLAQAHQFFMAGVGTRDNHVFYDLTLSDLTTKGTSGNDNPNGIYYPHTATNAQYTAITRVTADNFYVGPFKYYGNTYAVIEHTTISNFAPISSNGGNAMSFKGDNINNSFRDNHWITNVGTGVTAYQLVQWSGFSGGDKNEASYNRIVNPVKSDCNAGSGQKTMMWGDFNPGTSMIEGWDYRNTYIGVAQNAGPSGFCTPANGIDFENSVIVNDNAPACNRVLYNAACTGPAVGTIEDDWTNADRPVDANGLLQNVGGGTQWRDLYLGKKGAEIVIP